MKWIITVLAFMVVVLAYFLHRNVKMPLSTVRVMVPFGCEARKWGNAVELDCKDGNRIVYVVPLKEPSPR